MPLDLPLLALATGSTPIGVTEFAPMGMLPGVPLMTLTTGRIDRRTLLVGRWASFRSATCCRRWRTATGR